MGNLRVNAKSLILLVSVAAVLLAGDLVVYVVASGASRQVQNGLAAREAQVENSKKVASRLETSRRSYDEVQSKLTVLEHSVAQRAYIPTLLKQLENTGKTVKLDVVGVRPCPKPVSPAGGKPSSGSGEEGGASSDSSSEPASKPVKKEPPKPYDTMMVDVQLEGSYWNTMRFLEALTKFPKIVAVNSIEMSPNSGSLQEASKGRSRQVASPGLSVKLNMSAFVFPVEREIVPLTARLTTPSVTIEPVQPSRKKPQTSVRVSKKNWRSRHEAG